MCKTDSNSNFLTDSEKVEFLNLLKGKGEKPASNWTLIHSELCGPEEADLDHTALLAKLSSEKFAIDIVSNPNQTSFEDEGNVKIRYRYVLAAEHQGEQKIKDNTREFCEALINADLIYRREDINQMSFRGANPIATQNYSIFQLQGHWNCRHAWQREIFIVADQGTQVENGTKINTDIVMSTDKKTFKQKFGELLTSLGDKLTKEEIVEANKLMFGEEVFIDIDVDGKTLRVDAEKLEAGAAVSWMDAEGNLSEVEDGEIPVMIDEKPMIIVVENRMIKEVKDVESSEDSAAAETELDKNGKTEVKDGVTKSEFEEFKNSLPKMIADAVGTKMSDIDAKIDQKIKDAPAFKADNVSTNMSSNGNGKGEGRTMLERITIGQNNN